MALTIIDMDGYHSADMIQSKTPGKSTMIYLDYNATTPLDPSVVEAMKPFLEEDYGNPSSTHQKGLRAKAALESARESVARLLRCDPQEVIFTSGGSESNNTVIKGVASALKGEPRHIITTQIEHPAVLEPCRFLEREGIEVTYLGVDNLGRVNPRDVQDALQPHTILISVMHANNEVGTLQPVAEIGEVARKAGVLFHSDAAQTAGKIPIDVAKMNVDLLTIAGHKLYGPKGIGALYVKEGANLVPLIHGAGQERGRRAGTESVVLCVGLGAACRKAAAVQEEEARRVAHLRDYLYAGLCSHIPAIVLNGCEEARLPNTLHVSFPGKTGSRLLGTWEGVLASTGSACHEGSQRRSSVLSAMGVPGEVAEGAIRFSLGRWTTRTEIERVIELAANSFVSSTERSRKRRV